MNADVFRVGTLTFISSREDEDGKIGYGQQVIVDEVGSVGLWANADDLRAAAKFFSRLAEVQEKAERDIGMGCGCGCSNAKLQKIC